MRSLHLQDNRQVLRTALKREYPGWAKLIAKVRKHVPPHNKEVWEEQALTIALLASQYNRSGARLLEWGTNRGFTASVLRFAAPKAEVTTLEPVRVLRRAVRTYLTSLDIHVRPETSVAYLEADDRTYDMIFVDGDHKNIRLDLPWYNRLQTDGLFLHHDFSPLGSSRPCPPVYEGLTEFSRVLDHEPDVLVRDETGTGIAGWYRREGETWNAG
jgi:predicted O-methyltransferase YrrM